MIIEGKQHRALWLEGKTVKFIDQRSLPFSVDIFIANTVQEIAFAIKNMVVRGAPAIGAAAAYGMALGKNESELSENLLKATRPTAYDLFYAVEYMKKKISDHTNEFTAANNYVEDIIDRCKKIGKHGEKLIQNDMNILTHCNAGALATVDFGTALAPLRVAHRKGKKLFVYVDETRPRLQGLLTAWELYHEGITHSLIVDNAAGFFMRNGEIDMVITGADRIARNGDVANKIGTYEKAILAKENGIPFYIAAPKSTFDETIKSGEEIVIEEREKNEIVEVQGTQIMPSFVQVKNPSFDVTPSNYITGFITEEGIITK
jgi:translation initiation factor eIF-2B subunit alpha/methylthioribose-1-phosphate isomerase